MIGITRGSGFSGGSRRVGLSVAICTIVGIAFSAGASAQTLVQLTDLGQSIGARLTKAVARQRLGVDLFGAIGTKVSFIDNGTVYQLASDPSWGRILSGRMDYWVHDYDNRTGPGGRLRQPLGIDISARRYFYSADRANGFIFLAEFSPGAQNLVNPGVWTAPQFPRPVDVAWDGRTTPLTVDFLYVLDDSLGRVTYWDRPTLLWSYGTVGSGVGQFSMPSGVCVGKTAAATGGTEFTRHFYVVDRGNRRVVWLNRGDAGPTWMGSATLPNWDPVDCAVDHFGNVYVVDELAHRIHKFTWSLTPLSSYGTYGKGAGNLNTLAFPHAISVPCGLKVVNSQTVWYCEGRVITAESWSDSTGAVEHYLGLELSRTGGPTADTSTNVATFSYRVTDHAYHTVLVWDNQTIVRRLNYGSGLMPSGDQTVFWDGTKDDGTPAPPNSYHFSIQAVSAYGCALNSWCNQFLHSTAFWFYGDPCVGGNGPSGPDQPWPPPCDPDPAPRVAVEDEPTRLSLRQRVISASQPLTRLAPSAAAAPDVATTTPAGSLTELVRTYGVRGLTFGVPSSASTEPVTIRIFSVAGRPVRTLVNESLSAGYYEIAWDGLDDRGQQAGPGVYFAVLTARGQRIVQRLILRQSP